MNNQNSQKGNTFLIIAIIVGVVAIGITGFASWKYFGGGSELEKEIQPVYLPEKEKTVPQAKEQDEIIPSKKNKETANWKSYRNEEYGFEIKYPKDWNLAEVNKNPFNMTIWEGDGLNKDNIQMVEVYGFVSHGSIEGNLDYLKKRLKTEFNKMKKISITNGRGFYWVNKTKGGFSPSIYLVSKDHLFLMTYNIFEDTESVLTQSELIFNQILSTFKFTETDEISNSVKVLSPNGGEKWKIGNSYLIRWNSVGSMPQVKIYLVPVNSNAGIRYISNGPIANTNSYTYAIPYCGPGHECSSNFEISEGEYYIRITDSKGVASDQSDASFSIISN